MHLLVASRNSELTRSLEKELIVVYMAMRDIKLQNVDPEATGSMRGTPHFLYVTLDEPGPLHRRGRRAG